MPFSYLIFLKYCNKFLKTNSIIPYSELIPRFRLDNDGIDNLVNELVKLNLVTKVGRTSIITTYKGRTATYSYMMEWIFKNLIAVFALIVSVIALFRTF